jgi:uridine kinase
LNELLDEEENKARTEKLNPDLDKVSHRLTRLNDKEFKKASSVIFVAGCHPLQSEKLREMADLKIFMHTDDDIRLIMKIRRSPYYKRMVGHPYRD